MDSTTGPAGSDGICSLTATELAAILRAGELSAGEVTEACFDRIERVNPKVNAIVTFTPERAMQAARAADDALARGLPAGPLHGLPVAHKDLALTRDVRTTFGSPIFAHFVPEQDALIVERLKGAGAISVGKTDSP